MNIILHADIYPTSYKRDWTDSESLFYSKIIRFFLVKPAHLKLQADLKDVQGEMICKKPESKLMIDELVCKLQEKSPKIKGFERSNILRTISVIYGKKIEYMGKKKR